VSARKTRNGKPSRRKAGRKPVRKKKRKVSFRLTVEGQTMLVSYEPGSLAGYAHFEFRSPNRPPRRILVSETGYRSHFAPIEEVAAETSPQDYARAFVQSLLDGGSRQRSQMEAKGQLSLFG
jgi:hypothetical protein